jgi:hypothetical protein
MFIAPLPIYTRYNIMLGLCVCTFSLPRQAALGKAFPVATKHSLNIFYAFVLYPSKLGETNHLSGILIVCSEMYGDGSESKAKSYGVDSRGTIPCNG